MTAVASMLAMTRSRPPHSRQVSISIANTRLRRGAHDIPGCRSMAAGSLRSATARVLGTIRARSAECRRIRGGRARRRPRQPRHAAIRRTHRRGARRNAALHPLRRAPGCGYRAGSLERSNVRRALSGGSSASIKGGTCRACSRRFRFESGTSWSFRSRTVSLLRRNWATCSRDIPPDWRDGRRRSP